MRNRQTAIANHRILKVWQEDDESIWRYCWTYTDGTGGHRDWAPTERQAKAFAKSEAFIDRHSASALLSGSGAGLIPTRLTWKKED